MATQFSTHQANLSNKLNEEDDGTSEGRWSTSQRKLYLNDAAKDIYSMDWVFNKKVDTALSVSSGVADLPTDFGGKVIGFYWGDRKPGNKKGSISASEVAQQDTTSTGDAQFFYAEGGSIKTIPKGTKTCTLVYRMAANVCDEDDDEYTNLPINFDEPLALLAAAKAWFDRDEEVKSERFMARYTELIQKLEDEWTDYYDDRISIPGSVDTYNSDYYGNL